MSRSYGERERLLGKNGRVHIPSYIRLPLEIKEGDKLEFKVDEEKKIITIKKSE